MGSKSTISVNIKSGRKFKPFGKANSKIKFMISIVGFNQKAKTKYHSAS